MKAQLTKNSPSLSLQNPNKLLSQTSFPSALTGCLNTLDGACIEKLLRHCASALETNDVTLAQQVMWVINNVASSTGEPNQRLASYFLKALISKASRVCPNSMNFKSTVGNIPRRLMTVTELAGYVDLIPWHSFGFCASNSAILKAVQGFSRVHVLDFSITHCMQWPTLIDALAKGPHEAPMLKITVLSWRPPVPPLVNASIKEVGQRLANFAKSKDVPFEFHVVEVGRLPYDDKVSSSCDDVWLDSILGRLNPTSLKLREDEAFVVNCQNWLRYLPDDEGIRNCNEPNSYRDYFLETIKILNPRVVVVVDEDCDLGESSGSLSARITTCFNYLWIPFDALETFLPKNSPKRIEYEADIGHKIENIIGFEGIQRIERLESGFKLSRRMENKGFVGVPFCNETIRKAKLLLDEHASGWGTKIDEDMLILTWKGHSSVYATVWVPRDLVDED